MTLHHNESDIMTANSEHMDYVRQVRRPNSDDFFISTWGGCVIRNVDETGNLVQFSSKATYIRNRIPMWVFLKLVIFKNPNTDELYPAYQCNTCEEMKAVCSMSYEQDPDEIEELKCHHSKVCDILVGDNWQNTWDLDLNELQNRNESNEVLLHEEIEAVVFRSNNLFLGAVLSGNKVNLLYTINRAQKFPFCSKCPKQKCKCFKILENVIADQNERIADLDPSYDTRQYWEINLHPSADPVSHYDEDPRDFFMRYGYNTKRFLFPINRDTDLQGGFDKKMQGEFIYQSHFIPEVNSSIVCKHGNNFDEDQDSLIVLSDTITIISESSEQEHDVRRYGRPTVGRCCKCIIQADTHDEVG